MAYFNYKRRQSSVARIGDTPMGGDFPIRIQSMANVSTMDTDAAVAQAIRMIEAGAEYVRFTAQGEREARNLGEIRERLNERGYTTPLVADIHFNPRAADVAAEWVEKVGLKAGDKVRILKQFNIGERGVPFGFNDAMLSLIGDICEVFEIADNRIRVYDKYRVTYWVWPYFCLEKVEPEYVPFDLGKPEDRDALRGKWVKSKDPDYFYEYQITKFDQADHEIFINFEDGRTSGDELLKDFVFLDGSPVGKLKEDFDEG